MLSGGDRLRVLSVRTEVYRDAVDAVAPMRRWWAVGNTWPRWPPQFAQCTSVRTMPWLRSTDVPIAPSIRIKRLQRLIHGRVRIVSVQLVEIDVVRAETAQ
jgi:hypothetical protein